MVINGTPGNDYLSDSDDADQIFGFGGHRAER